MNLDPSLADDQPDRPATPGGPAVPSRFRILAALDGASGALELDDLAASLGVESAIAREALETRLQRMVENGLLRRSGKQRFDLVRGVELVTGNVSGHADGYGFVQPDGAQGREGDVYLSAQQMQRVIPGDKVLVRVQQGRRGLDGRLVEVLGNLERTLVGRIVEDGDALELVPTDARNNQRFRIESAADLAPGDIVLARVTEHPATSSRPAIRVEHRLGREGDQGIETEIAIHNWEIPSSWPDEVLDQVSAMGQDLVEVTGQIERERVDLTTMDLVTIDGADARDFDDAVYCEPDGKGWRLVVAIADVSHYVLAGSAMDQEALHRGNSVYFPRRVVPMLPEQLSNGICSLNPDVLRNCMVCDARLSASGDIEDATFYPARMRSRARLTYDEVHEITALGNQQRRAAWGPITDALDRLYALHQVLRKKRMVAGSIDFEFPESVIRFDDKGDIEAIVAAHRNDAHRLIEECMLVANICSARFLLERYGQSAIYRNHDGPEPDALVTLRTFLKGVGLRLAGGDAPRPEHYADLIGQLAEQPQLEATVKTMLLRTLGQAEYGATNEGHFALAFPAYTHFTSPIRRYSDLVVHRLIKHAVSPGMIAAEHPGTPMLASIAEQCSLCERRADQATWEVIKVLKTRYMAQHVGESFDGRVTGVREFGIFVEIPELMVDGLLHVSRLGHEYYRLSPKSGKLVGERSGTAFGMGDEIRIRVDSVDEEEMKINFSLAKPRTDEPVKAGRRGKNRPRRRSKAR